MRLRRALRVKSKLKVINKNEDNGVEQGAPARKGGSPTGCFSIGSALLTSFTEI